MDANDLALAIVVVGIAIIVTSVLEGAWRPASQGLGPAAPVRYDDAGRRRARPMHTESPQRHTIDEIDARESRKRDRFAHLALIAPTPEMIREVMALEDGAAAEQTATTERTPEPQSVTADR